MDCIAARMLELRLRDEPDCYAYRNVILSPGLLCRLILRRLEWRRRVRVFMLTSGLARKV